MNLLKKVNSNYKHYIPFCTLYCTSRYFPKHCFGMLSHKTFIHNVINSALWWLLCVVVGSVDNTLEVHVAFIFKMKDGWVSTCRVMFSFVSAIQANGDRGHCERKGTAPLRAINGDRESMYLWNSDNTEHIHTT